MAMRAEAQPIIDALGATPCEAVPDDPLPSRWYAATRSGIDVIVAVNGVDPQHGVDAIATQPAALTTYATCRRWPIDLVITAGVAGGWARCGASVGDVYVSGDRFVYHDRRIALGGVRGVRCRVVPLGRRLAARDRLGFRQGIVTTSNSLDETDDDRRMIAASGACVKDMEAAAVADVARLFGDPSWR